VDFRLRNIIEGVQFLRKERDVLLVENENLRVEIESLKVVVDKQNKTTDHKKQHGTDDEVSPVVDSTEYKSVTQNQLIGEKSKVDSVKLKMQIDNAIEEIDQCIHIISAK
jgi:hypothetical protein